MIEFPMPLTDDHALGTYIRSVESEAKAAVCGHRAEGFTAEFERRYRAWRRANAEAFAKGAALAEAGGLDGEHRGSVKAFARMGAQVLAQLPDDDRQRRCDELLSSFLEAGRSRATRAAPSRSTMTSPPKKRG